MMDHYNNTTATLLSTTGIIPYHCQRYAGYQDHYAARWLLSLLYSLVFVVAVSGNSLVVYVVLTNREMQSVTNIFITNLAVADLLVNFTSLWLTPCYIFLGRWIWGSVMCHAVPLFQGSSTFISALTLTAIAVDRYMVILHPFRARMSMACCLAIVGGIWIVATVLVAPLVVHMDLYHYAACDEYVCREEWSDYPEMRVAYGFVVMSLQFFVPFLLIAYCYVRIWIWLKSRKSLINEHRSSISSTCEEQRKKRLLKMMVCMVVIFGLCWLPVNTLNVLRDSAAFDMEDYFVIVFLFAHLCSMSATCWNPILYAFMNDNFRREFQAVLPCFRDVTDRLRRSSSMMIRSASTRRRSSGPSGSTHSSAMEQVRRKYKSKKKRTGDAADRGDRATMQSSPYLHDRTESALISCEDLIDGRFNRGSRAGSRDLGGQSRNGSHDLGSRSRELFDRSISNDAAEKQRIRSPGENRSSRFSLPWSSSNSNKRSAADPCNEEDTTVRVALLPLRDRGDRRRNSKGKDRSDMEASIVIATECKVGRNGSTISTGDAL